MSGPSSSDITTRKKFLITERNDPLPCCTPASNYLFLTTDVSGAVPEVNYAGSTLTGSITVNYNAPIAVVGIANVTGAAGDVVKMGVFVTSPVATNVQVIPDVTVTLPASGNATLFGTGTIDPVLATGVYTFSLLLKQTVGTVAYWNNATLYAQAT